MESYDLLQGICLHRQHGIESLIILGDSKFSDQPSVNQDSSQGHEIGNHIPKYPTKGASFSPELFLSHPNINQLKCGYGSQFGHHGPRIISSNM